MHHQVGIVESILRYVECFGGGHKLCAEPTTSMLLRAGRGTTYIPRATLAPRVQPSWYQSSARRIPLVILSETSWDYCYRELDMTGG